MSKKSVFISVASISMIFAAYWFVVRPNILAKEACISNVSFHPAMQSALGSSSDYYVSIDKIFKTKDEAMDYCILIWKTDQLKFSGIGVQTGRFLPSN